MHLGAGYLLKGGHFMSGFLRRHSTIVLDRHPLWLSELGKVLERGGFAVAGATTSEARALQLLRQHDADVLIFEPEACSSSTARFLEAVRSANSNLKTIAMSTVDDSEVIRATLDAGAWAYVLKSTHPDDIAVAVRQAFAHSIHIAGTITTPRASSAPRPETVDRNGISILTRREREILALVAEGHSNSAMAQILWVTEQTVKFHLSNIYRKLDVPNRTAATRWAHEHGVMSKIDDPAEAVVA
jgi:DNA-binding NarL/FixJ family response regulator